MSTSMEPKDIYKARNPDLQAALVAMQRAAQLARLTAIQTDTAIVVVQDGQRMRITAEQLRQERNKE